MMTATDSITIHVTARTYRNCLDPDVTRVPVEEGWPEPDTFRRYGRRGGRYTYVAVQPDVARRIADWLAEWGEAFASGVDPETAADARAARADADRIHAAVAGGGVDG